MRILVFISLVILAIFYNFFLNIIINDINIFQTINEYALTEGLLLGDDLRQYENALMWKDNPSNVAGKYQLVSFIINLFGNKSEIIFIFATKWMIYTSAVYCLYNVIYKNIGLTAALIISIYLLFNPIMNSAWLFSFQRDDLVTAGILFIMATFIEICFDYKDYKFKIHHLLIPCVGIIMLYFTRTGYVFVFSLLSIYIFILIFSQRKVFQILNLKAVSLLIIIFLIINYFFEHDVIINSYNYTLDNQLLRIDAAKTSFIGNLINHVRYTFFSPTPLNYYEILYSEGGDAYRSLNWYLIGVTLNFIYIPVIFYLSITNIKKIFSPPLLIIIINISIIWLSTAWASTGPHSIGIRHMHQCQILFFILSIMIIFLNKKIIR